MLHEPCREKICPSSDINLAVQLHKMASGLKSWFWEVEGLFYLCSENKGVDQLGGNNRSADQHLCFLMTGV